MAEGKELILAPEFVVPAEKIAGRIQELQTFVKQYMVEGEDFGTIPGTRKPTLYKPGAEKLCDIYGFQRLFDTMNRVEDWDKGLFHYEVRASLVDARTGLIVAQGLGCANTKEAHYRWRDERPTCEKCERELRRSDTEWYCWRKRGGCGATFPLDEIKAGGRVENDDPYTLVNTVLKMAKKRALVDAVLSATRSSGLFTQDVEDIIEGSAVPINGGATEAEPPAPAAAKARRRPRPAAELEAEGREIVRQREGPQSWGCSHCGFGGIDWQKETGRPPLPGTEKNCPGCGHVRGAKAEVPAGEAAIEEGITAGADGPVDVTPGQSHPDSE